ncbi:hypothetical protein DQ04_11681010 [Trypanosoma grayi]|uniref:hypothetical protein n=1 Tax=Trypanosoma grayi TaxID=71804 RepID=UPI0004F4B5B1|nr:hypothetical protein DQ04_11681010 [Trypanosoma grayi]KEG06911.1 hypothetical protein DQ04_11681010 [Trypanosoma grayi]
MRATMSSGSSSGLRNVARRSSKLTNPVRRSRRPIAYCTMSTHKSTSEFSTNCEMILPSVLNGERSSASVIWPVRSMPRTSPSRWHVWNNSARSLKYVLQARTYTPKRWAFAIAAERIAGRFSRHTTQWLLTDGVTARSAPLISRAAALLRERWYATISPCIFSQPSFVLKLHAMWRPNCGSDHHRTVSRCTT